MPRCDLHRIIDATKRSVRSLKKQDDLLGVIIHKMRACASTKCSLKGHFGLLKASLMIKCHLSRLLGERKLKISDVARDTGVNRGTLTRLYHETAERVELETLNVLCRSEEHTSELQSPLNLVCRLLLE